MALQVPAPRINDIVRERHAVTVDTALQTDFDMATARATMADVLGRISAREVTHN